MTSLLRISHSPDPDDAFAWWALRQGRVRLPVPLRAHFEALTMQRANAACLLGELDVAAISSASYPLLHRDYALLAVGASVGRGYGPALATRDLRDTDQLAGRRVAVPGLLTTGALLLRVLFPRVEVIEMTWDAIAPAVAAGEVAAGVLIHEELMNWRDRGLRRLACLGMEWERQTGLPIPVGLVVAHRRLGEGVHRAVATALLRSVLEGFAHRSAALDFAMTYSCQTSPGIGEAFVDMFTNDDTLALADDVRVALHALYLESHRRGLIPEVPPIIPVEPDSTHCEVA